MTDTLTPKETPENRINPLEAARFLRAYDECSHEMQETVLEMAAIISDEASSQDEMAVAFDAMMEALFPGTTADVLERYRELLKSPGGAEAAAELKAEEHSFTERVRNLMREKNITQEVLAAAAEIGQPAVSNILNRGCRPQRRTVARFAEALGVAPTDLWPQYTES